MLAAAFCFLTAPIAPAQQRGEPIPVDLELVIAVDVSASMDREEFALQRFGYVAAIRHPDFLRAVAGGPYARIALSYVEWSGSRLQRVVMPWRLIDGEASARAFAAELALQKLFRSSGTSISAALAFSTGHIAANGFEGLRKVIDISGDGPNNYGPPVTAARDAALAAGVVVNGLPILIRPSPIFPAMDRYYLDCVIGGPGAFAVPIHEASEFATAVRRKLVVEVAGLATGRGGVILAAAEEPVDCLIGERMRKLYADPHLPGLAD